MDMLTQLLLLVGGSFVLGAVLVGVGIHRRGRFGTVIALTLGALSLAVSGFAGYATYANWDVLRGPEGPTAEEMAEPMDFDYRLVTDDGEASLADHRGKVVLLNIWATWCIPCIEEMPRLQRLLDEYGPDGLVVLTLTKEPREVALGSVQKLPEDAVNAYTPDQDALPPPIRRNFAVYPTTFVFDREGYIKEYFTATRPYRQFVKRVEPYM